MIDYKKRRANMILLLGNSSFLIVYLFVHYFIFFYIKCVNFEYLNSAHHLPDFTLTPLLQFILIFKNPFYFFTKYYLCKKNLFCIIYIICIICF